MAIFIFPKIIFYDMFSSQGSAFGLAHNVRQLCEGMALENVCLNLAKKLNRITNIEFCTSAVLLQNCLFCVRFLF
jgi:hypothetical protein